VRDGGRGPGRRRGRPSCGPDTRPGGGTSRLGCARRFPWSGLSAGPVIRLGHPERLISVGRRHRLRSGKRLIAEQQIVAPQAVRLHMCRELGGDLGAELEPAELPALGIVLDHEPAAGRMLAGAQLDYRPADGQDPGGRVQVADPQLGQLAPAQAAFNVGLDQQPEVPFGKASYSWANCSAVMIWSGFSATTGVFTPRLG